MHTKTMATIAGFAAFAAATTANAGFTTIDFGPQYFKGTPGMVALTDQFEHLGVRFSSLLPNDNVYWDLGSGLGIPFTIRGRKPPRFVNQNSEYAMRIEFIDPASIVSISAYDSGGDTDTVLLEAFNAAGDRVSFDTVTSTLSQRETLAVVGEGITSVTITVTSSSGRGASIDDLFFYTQN
ncbi:MAG: hypothetical protein ACF8MF_10490 [Phycisphaerales bacterium JB052]